mmetsp:Transcript_3127/g.6787  ORF Transcript_3127/g.6787 Transcript_3127/m.6787 type:complete len:271 (-) Transcript_3127:20-832(-)
MAPRPQVISPLPHPSDFRYHESLRKQLRIKAVASILTAVSIYKWMDRLFLRTMRLDAMQMAHLDPTEIIAKPMPIGSVIRYTRNSMITTIAISCIGSILWNRQCGMSGGGGGGIISNLVQSILTATLGIVFLGSVLFAIVILAGASPFVDTLHTFLASLYAISLAFGPSLIFDAREYLQSPEKTLVLLLCGPPWQGPCHKIDSFALYGTFIAMVPTMILRILDHGDQVQRWPFPMLLGSSIGYCAGSFVGILSSYVVLMRPIRKKDDNKF